MSCIKRASYVFTLVSVALLAAPVAAQEKKVLTLEDYGQWQRINSVSLSPDGEWMSYGYNPNEGDGTLHIRKLGADGPVHDIPLGSNPSFSNDGAWVVYRVNPEGSGGGGRGGRGGRGRGGRGRGGAPAPAGAKLVLQDLGSGDKVSFANAGSAEFSEDSAYLVIRKSQVGDAEHDGADILLRNLASGVTQNIGNVSSYSFNKSGTLLAYTVDAADNHGNGLYLLELESGTLSALDCAEADYEQLTWDEGGRHLAALCGAVPEKKEHRANRLIAFTHVGTGRETRVDYHPWKDESFPGDMVLSEMGALTWSGDGRMLFFGIKEQVDAPEESDDERANVDVWHWDDSPVQSVQERRAGQNSRATYRCAFILDGAKCVRLADEGMPNVTIAGEGRWGLGRVTEPYRHDVTWGGSRADHYKVDLSTGDRSLITQALGRPMGTSPDGRWFLFLKARQVWAENLDTGAAVNLSKGAPVDFVNEDDDHPYEKPAWGVAGWTSDGNAVILNHRFDLWLCPLSGDRATNITAGLGDREQIRFRYTTLDPEEETIDTSDTLLLSAYGEWTKKSGYYTVDIGQQPRPLFFVDKSVGNPIVAEDADVVALTLQTFEEFPDYWVTNKRFENPVRVTDANPQQSEYAWGRRVLVDYENRRGVPLQGTLALPAGYEEGKQYPMLVYFYEKMSQRHHQYSMPQYDDRPHMSTYASDGYLVLMPDVVYLPGLPGDCATDCVTSAVQKVIDLGYADPERIVLQGHSWGGYQSSFILTQTDMFCAVVTGAPVTNLVSFYDELYKSSGSVQQGITEVGQVRMGTTPWDNMELFHSQSPLHNVRNITTPFIILHGTEDGSVDWHQGLEYYNAAKRNGKEVILLSYPGEGHHLGNRANQIDFLTRMKQFFDHYAKGTPAPEWMKKGVPFLEKDISSPNGRSR